MEQNKELDIEEVNKIVDMINYLLHPIQDYERNAILISATVFSLQQMEDESLRYAYYNEMCNLVGQNI